MQLPIGLPSSSLLAGGLIWTITQGTAVAGIFYKIAKDKIQYLSKEQFVLLFEEYFRQLLDAKKRGVPFDFHGGNFGFRSQSDIPMPYDI